MRCERRVDSNDEQPNDEQFEQPNDEQYEQPNDEQPNDELPAGRSPLHGMGLACFEAIWVAKAKTNDK